MSQALPETSESKPLYKNRPLVRLLAAQFSTTTAVYGLALAGIVLVEDLTHSSAGAGAAIATTSLPAFLGSLVSGAVIDRKGRVPVLLASHLVRGLFALAFWAGTLLLTGIEGLSLIWILALVYAVNTALALFTQFATPSELAMLPDLAGQEGLMSANTAYQFAMLVAEMMGIVVLTPLLIRLGGAPTIGLVGALLFAAALLLVATLPRKLRATALDQPAWSGWSALFSDLQGGWRTIARDRLLRLVVLQATLAAVLLLVLLALTPGIAARHLGLAVENATYMLLPGGVGFILGAFAVNRWEHRTSRQGWIATGLVLVGVSTGLLALALSWQGSAAIAPAGGTLLGLGLGLGLIIIPARTVLEERPPAEMRGRVIAAQLALANAVAIVPLLLGGALADQIGIQPVMAILAVLALLAGAAGLRNKP
jgi:MFS family permease